MLAADFDNDGDIDIFMPHYTHLDDGGHNWLLINDGARAASPTSRPPAGVAINLHFPPEGAQALDVNEDGWIDILVASKLFINNGDLTFTDQAAALALPIARSTKGMRLFDVDLDGDFDLVHHDTLRDAPLPNATATFDAGRVVNGEPGQGRHFRLRPERVRRERRRLRGPAGGQQHPRRRRYGRAAAAAQRRRHPAS